MVYSGLATHHTLMIYLSVTKKIEQALQDYEQVVTMVTREQGRTAASLKVGSCSVKKKLSKERRKPRFGAGRPVRARN